MKTRPEAIAILRRRLTLLQKRIADGASANKDLSYDKAEASALERAITDMEAIAAGGPQAAT